MIGLLALAVPVFIWILWIVTFSSNAALPQEEKVEKYLSFFPSFLHSPRSISVTALIFAGASIFLSTIGRRKADDTFKVLSVAAIVVASAIILLQLFTML
ncbi:MAG TPA: hypothetical protein VJN65_06245 [Bacteroidota bacterium]|nr:hypothetical protein [Bacteroidota bacterium]